MKKSTNLTCHTHFALISRDFVRFGWYCTWNTTISAGIFRILLTNLQNCKENVLFCFEVNQDKNPLKMKLSLRGTKCTFWSNLIFFVDVVQYNMHILVLHEKYQPKWTKSEEMRSKSVWPVKFVAFFNWFYEFFHFCPFFRNANLKY